MLGRKGGGAGEATSVIGAEMVVTGNIGGTGSLRVDGQVDGDVECAALMLSEGGTVNGNIRADRAEIAGAVNGAVAAKSLSIAATARIAGDLSYDAVSIAAGAVVEGRVKRLTRDDAGGALKLVSNELLLNRPEPA